MKIQNVILLSLAFVLLANVFVDAIKAGHNKDIDAERAYIVYSNLG
jgi:hypothetical protein